MLGVLSICIMIIRFLNGGYHCMPDMCKGLQMSGDCLTGNCPKPVLCHVITKGPIITEENLQKLHF